MQHITQQQSNFRQPRSVTKPMLQISKIQKTFTHDITQIEYLQINL